MMSKLTATWLLTLTGLASLGSVLVPVVTLGSDAVLIEFSQNDCQFCVAMRPVVSQLQSEKITVRHVDVDKESDMAVRFGIQQIPTFVIFSGGKEASRLVGVQEIDTIRKAIADSGRVHLTPTDAQTRLAPVTPAPNHAAVPTYEQATYEQAARDPMPSQSLADAVQRAQAATVRIRVFEEVGYGVGTGTIIQSNGQELLVLTCGHLFRDTRGGTKIEVDLFHAGQVHTVEGRVISYDAKDRDIGLLAIQTSLPIQPVPVAPSSTPPRNGDSVFSFGCDRGADPSRRDTRLTGINKYNQHLQLSNLEIAGAPIDGRSGGGLFNSQGQLIGVCNAADYNDDIGIYAGPGEVDWVLTQAGIPTNQVANTVNQVANTTISTLDQSQFNAAPATNNFVAQRDTEAAEIAQSSDQEVIVIVRSRSNPAQGAKVVTFNQAPPQLLQMLQQPQQ